MAELGRKIKELRLAKGITATELASRSGVARSLISQLESGKRQSTGIDVISRLAKVLEVSPSVFFPDESIEHSPVKSLNDAWLVKEENEFKYRNILKKVRSAQLPLDFLDELLDLLIKFNFGKPIK